MFEDYKNAVLNFYAEQKNHGLLAEDLEKPTQAQLRKVCLLILRDRVLTKEDEKTIKTFFDPTNKFEDLGQSIEKFELDGFKAVYKFFWGSSGIRKEENIKLLALLIGFPSYKDWKMKDAANKQEVEQVVLPVSIAEISDPVDNKLEAIVEEINNTKNDEKLLKKPPLKTDLVTEEIRSGIDTKDDSGKTITGKKPSSNDTHEKNNWWNKPTKSKIWTATICSVFIASIVFASYYLYEQNNQCMYWTGDHYESISCSENVDFPSIAFNENASKLKRITRPDTLTMNAIGHVWYAKVKVDSAEFYTDSGDYPLDTRKRLLPITEYMLNKYVFAKRQK